MRAEEEAGRGPSLGEPAPFIEALSFKKSQKSDNSRGGWIILVSHPQDLLPLFRTRTINYILCKRRTRIVMLDADPSESVADSNFLTKYMTRHNVTFLDDPDGVISPSYGLGSCGPGEETKGVFVIDPGGVLRIKLYFDLAHPRNFYEILKLVDALQQSDSERKKRPASGWKRRLSIVSRPGTVPEPEKG